MNLIIDSHRFRKISYQDQRHCLVLLQIVTTIDSNKCNTTNIITTIILLIIQTMVIYIMDVSTNVTELLLLQSDTSTNTSTTQELFPQLYHYYLYQLFHCKVYSMSIFFACDDILLMCNYSSIITFEASSKREGWSFFLI